jgi:transposase InsO family protein
VVKPQGRRRLVSFFEQTFGLSRRKACSLAGISRSVVAYQPRRPSDDDLRERILALARVRPHGSLGNLTPEEFAQTAA